MNIELRDYKMEIAEQFAKYRNNSTVLDNGYDSVPNPYTLNDAKEFIALQLITKPGQRQLIFCDNQLAGEVGISINEDVFRMSAEIGYFIAEPFWGMGIATEAIRMMIEYAFKNFDVIRIEAGVFEFNKSSMRVLEKNGFHLESIKKKAVFKNGKILDDHIWVKLKE
ncbi:MAG: GNAT family protein [Cyclobacteriaceae bacterium]